MVSGKLRDNLIKRYAEAEGLVDEAHLQYTRAAERQLDTDDSYAYRMSDVRGRVLGNLDLEAFGEHRMADFAALERLTAMLGLMPIRTTRGGRPPLFLPVPLPDCDRVRAALAA